MPKFAASLVYTLSGPPIKNGTVVTDTQGTIVSVLPADHPDAVSGSSEIMQGALVPGFINTHCHLELSHMKGKISPDTHLNGFIEELMGTRASYSPEEIQNGIAAAENEMLKNGIVAVGDISNTRDSFNSKKKSSLFYHTFIELLGLNPDRAEKSIADARQLLLDDPDINGSLSPHAPYSLSAKLLALLEVACADKLVSIHNQETESEDELFLSGKGALAETFLKMGFPAEFLRVTGLNSPRSTWPYFIHSKRFLLVHNTFTTAEDLAYAKALFPNHEQQLFWCFCPNANMYIENRLPDIPLFLTEKMNITIGTDSLASNHQLSVLEELKTIHQQFPEISLERLLKWGCLNGATFLGRDQLGSIEPGKQPGIVLLEQLENEQLTMKTVAKRLI